MLNLLEKWTVKIFIIVCIIALGFIAVDEAEKVEKCNSLNGVMIDGKCLDIKELK